MGYLADIFTQDFGLLSIIIRLIMSVVAGGILGWDRERRGRAAGFRTHILVCFSACIIMVVNMEIFNEYNTGDPTRMAAQVISGIGFLGAGSIIVTSKNHIKGLTTAAGLWAAACLGLCIGAGFYLVSIISVIIIYVTLAVFDSLDRNITRGKTHEVTLYIEFANITSMSEFVCGASEDGMRVADIEKIADGKGDEKIIAVTLNVRLNKARRHEEIIDIISKKEGILNLVEI